MTLCASFHVFFCFFLGERPAAIVTSIAGTTRDVVEQYINISGYPLSLADTAGIRPNSAVNDVVEKEGIARAKQFAETSDILLLVIDSQQFLLESDWLSKQDTEAFLEYVKLYSLQLGLERTLECEPRVMGNENSPTMYVGSHGLSFKSIFIQTNLILLTKLLQG